MVIVVIFNKFNYKSFIFQIFHIEAILPIITGVVKFLSKRLTFRVHNFTSAPDRACKEWVVKIKVFVRSRQN